jgi:predicted transcriptional regulator
MKTLTLLIAGLAVAETLPAPKLTKDGLLGLQAIARVDADLQKQVAELQKQFGELQKRIKEEVTDPRKEIIAVQCERAKLPADCELKADGTLAAKKIVPPASN